MKSELLQKTKQPRQLLALLLLTSFLTSCSLLGADEAPSTNYFNGRVIYAASLIKASRESINDLASFGKISKVQAQELANNTDLAQKSLDAVRELHKTNEAQASTDLTKLINTITILRSTISSLGK